MKPSSFLTLLGLTIGSSVFITSGVAQTSTVTTTTTTTTTTAKSDAPAEATVPAKDATYATPAAPSMNNLRTNVQVTELGCMRALLLLDDAAFPLEKLIAQRLTEADFRVFPGAQAVPTRLTAAGIAKQGRNVGIAPEELKKAGDAMQADLVIFVTSSSREKARLGEFQLHEGEATVQVFSPVTGELLVSHTSRESGVRDIDPVMAHRSAVERSVDAATKEAITKSLEKAHKLIVHQAVITRVQSHDHLLTIMDYMAHLKGVYHVRRISHDVATQTAVIEIIGAPQTETFWRAHLAKMPKAQIVDMSFAQNDDLRKRYPSWWTTP